MMTESLEEMLIRHEGLKLKPYLDSVGVETIGVGRNLKDTGITYEEAIYLLRNDIQKASKDVNMFPWFDTLNNPRKTVILNMVFNMGVNRFMGFRNMISALIDADYVKASKEMLDSTWAHQVGNRAIELAQIMEKGE